MSTLLFTNTGADLILGFALLVLFLAASSTAHPHNKWSLRLWGIGFFSYSLSYFALDAAVGSSESIARQFIQDALDIPSLTPFLTLWISSTCVAVANLGLTMMVYSILLLAYQENHSRIALTNTLAFVLGMIGVASFMLMTLLPTGWSMYQWSTVLVSTIEIGCLLICLFYTKRLKIVPTASVLFMGASLLIVGTSLYKMYVSMYTPDHIIGVENLEKAMWFILNFAMLLIAGKLAIREYIYDAETDVLTGAYNRRGLFRWMDVRNMQIPTKPSIALAFDIDHFKELNDRYGHDTGDKALFFISHIVRDTFGIQEYGFARMGGEEFLILFPDKSLVDANELASILQEAISDFDWTTKIGLFEPLTVSIGLSERHLNETIETWLDRTDQALYKAKQQGRNCIKISTL